MNRCCIVVTCCLVCALPILGQDISSRERHRVQQLQQEIAVLEDSVRADSLVWIRKSAEAERLRTWIQGARRQVAVSDSLKSEVVHRQALADKLWRKQSALSIEVEKLERQTELQCEQLNNEQRELDALVKVLSPYAADLRQKEMAHRLSLLDNRFSTMRLTQLQEWKTESEHFKGLKGYDRYLKRLKVVIENKRIYDDGMQMLEEPFAFDQIVKFREVKTMLRVMKEFKSALLIREGTVQFYEMDSLDLRLSRYIEGMNFLKSMVKEVNCKRKNKNPEQCRKMLDGVLDMNNSPYMKRWNERFQQMSDYMDGLFSRYCKELKENPMQTTTVETEILHYKTKAK